jgi:hypothetical protein
MWAWAWDGPHMATGIAEFILAYIATRSIRLRVEEDRARDATISRHDVDRSYAERVRREEGTPPPPPPQPPRGPDIEAAFTRNMVDPRWYIVMWSTAYARWIRWTWFYPTHNEDVLTDRPIR